MKTYFQAGLATALLGLLAHLSAAVSPKAWQHGTEADFAPAAREQTVVDSLGNVTLARDVEMLMTSEQAPTVVSAVCGDGENLFVGSGTDGTIWKIVDGKASRFAKLPAGLVTCLARKGRTLLAGGGGNNAGIYLINPKGKVRKLFAHEDVRYVWALLPARKNTLYAATGPNGQVWKVNAKGKGEVLYDADDKLAKNILCLAPGPGGLHRNLLAGTDTQGLVVLLRLKDKTSRVLLDAPEKEITAVLADGNGGAYAATGDLARANGKHKPDDNQHGKPASQPKEDQAPEGNDAEDAARGNSEPNPDEDDLAAEYFAEEPQPEAEDSLQRGSNHAVPEEPRTRPAEDDSASLSLAPAPKTLEEQKKRKMILLLNRKTGKARLVPADQVKRRPSGSGRATTSAPSGEKRGESKESPRPAGPPPGGSKGNAVYHITAKGMILPIFRRPVLIQAMLRQGGRLILATGNGGKILYLTPDGMIAGELLDTDAKQVTALAELPDGRLVFGTSNAGAVGRIGGRFAKTGTLTSKPLNAGQVAQFGTLRLQGHLPPETTVTVATRSGNTVEPDEATWSDFSAETPLAEGYLPIGSPAGRFLQYRLTLKSKTGKVSPTVGGIELLFQRGNLPPVVAAIQAQPSTKGTESSQRSTTKAYRLVKFKAGDPNRDKLLYRIDYRPVDTAVWVRLVEDLTKTEYAWDTRGVEDGRYELRITASDSPSNPTPGDLQARRISEPLDVDNTAPKLSGIKARVVGRRVELRGRASDPGSRLVRFAWAADNTDTWKPFLPADGMCDSGRETFRFRTEKLQPGRHRIILRAEDLFGNVGYAGVNVLVK